MKIFQIFKLFLMVALLAINVKSYSLSYLMGTGNQNGIFGDPEKLGEAIGKGLSDGLTNGIGGATDKLFENLLKNVKEGGQGSEALQAIFESLAKAFGGGGKGNEMVSNFFKSFGDQFADKGEGAQALNNFFKMFEELWKSGEGRKAFESFFEMVGDQFRHGGSGENALNDTVATIGKLFKRGGEIDKALRGGIDNFGDIFGAGGEFEGLLNKFGKMFEPNGAFDKQGDNLTKFTDRSVDRFFDTVDRATDRFYDIVSDFTDNLRGEVDKFTIDFAADALHMLQRNLIYFGGAAGVSTALVTSGYYGNKVFWAWVDRVIKRPKLIIESSYRGPWHRLKDFVMLRKKNQVEMVFDKDLASQLDDIVKATKNINKRIKEGKKNVKYRNLLLHGKPGTGKTMYAKKLAYESGMEYVMMSGSSFAKFKKGEGIIAMDELFAWANKSKGLLIFIDEAESFLSKREDMKPDSEKYQILNNFLNYTGERSDKFMIVFATNHIKHLDSAMWRRIDDAIEIPLPKFEQRKNVLKLYVNNILFDKKQNGTAFVEAALVVMNDAKIATIAEKTEGLSNGDLQGIVNSILVDANISDDGMVSHKIVDLVVDRAVKKLETFQLAALSGENK